MNWVVPEYPKRIQIGILDGYCNLKCPMCFMHSETVQKNRSLCGKMSLQDMCKILDEVMDAKPTILPHRWSEPLVNRDFPAYVREIKARKLPIVMNTNGFLITPKLADFFADIQFDSITVSIDAMTPETLQAMRGTNELEKLKDNIFSLLKARGKSNFPRIGVSFTLGPDNQHEKDEFVAYWLKYVDVVRVNRLYGRDKKVFGFSASEERIQCADVYTTLVVDYKGDATVCCLDALSQTHMGNVLAEGVKNVWHGRRFTEFRLAQRQSIVSEEICAGCIPLDNLPYNESRASFADAGETLVRESPVMTFYNRVDRLGNWSIKR